MPEEREKSDKQKLKDAFGKQSDWNMAVMEFTRWAKVIDLGTEFAVKVRLGRNNHVRNLFSICMELYIQWKGMMNTKDVEAFDKIIDACNLDLRKQQHDAKSDVEMIKVGLIKNTLDFWEEIHRFKQAIGMGIPMSRNMSDKERFGMAL